MLPYGKQTIDQTDIDAVVKVLESDWLTTGPAVEAFEQALCNVTGAQYAAACSNGTTGLHLAAMAATLGPGDYAIVPAITFAATANAVRMTGAEVVFADVDPNNGLLTPQSLTAALHRVPNGRAKAVFVVHLAGQVCDMRGIAQVARTHNMTIIEDACHALGSRYGRYALDKAGDCKFSDMAVFSFHPVKTITTAEGGAITTNNPLYDTAIKKLRNHDLERDENAWKVRKQAFEADGTPRPWYYEMTNLGYNYRLTDLQCALGVAQLGKLDDFVQKRADLVKAYKSKLADINYIVRPMPQAWFTEPSWHLMVVLIDWFAAGTTRTNLMLTLKKAGITTQVHYIPVYRQPYYLRQKGTVLLGGAELYYERCLSLPLFPTMSADDVDFVITELKQALPALNEDIHDE